jgi:hypothetical protein
MLLSNLSSLKIGAMKTVLLLRVSIDLQLYFPRVLSDLGGNRYIKYAPNAVVHFAA